MRPPRRPLGHPTSETIRSADGDPDDDQGNLKILTGRSRTPPYHFCNRGLTRKVHAVRNVTTRIAKRHRLRTVGGVRERPVRILIRAAVLPLRSRRSNRNDTANPHSQQWTVRTHSHLHSGQPIRGGEDDNGPKQSEDFNGAVRGNAPYHFCNRGLPTKGSRLQQPRNRSTPLRSPPESGNGTASEP